jgi:hypothetical protein
MTVARIKDHLGTTFVFAMGALAVYVVIAG